MFVFKGRSFLLLIDTSAKKHHGNLVLIMVPGTIYSG